MENSYYNKVFSKQSSSVQKSDEQELNATLYVQKMVEKTGDILSRGRNMNGSSLGKEYRFKSMLLPELRTRN